MRASGSLRHVLGSFACIIAGSSPGRSTYPAVRIRAATSTIAGGGESDGITEVNVRAINQYETGCNLVSGHLAGANVYAGSFECSVEGNTSSSPINLKLVNGKLGVNGNKPLTRCAA